ncbi:MAG TPA: glycoside hydrolase family 2 TIM barrel-domain containing protein [Cellulomonas sp.]
MDIARPGPGTGALAPRARLRTDAPEQSLDGTWSFRVSPSPRHAPDDGWEVAERLDPSDGWTTIPVPSHWVLEGHGAPAYSNVQFPFPVDPPFPPEDNPVGDHRLTFDVDADLLPWVGPQGADAIAGGRALLRFDGVESAAEITLNGTWVGSTRGSRLTHEFDVTALLRPHGNRLAVRVAQFSDASYLEDQDMWWLPGIFRSVTLLAAPSGGVPDVWVRADLDPQTGLGSLTVTARTDAPGGAVLRVPELGVQAPADGVIPVGAVEPWSAEHPRLYEATVSTPTETVRLRLGFRRVEVRAAVLLVNGAPIRLAGVNRHEHHPERGRVHDLAWARAELLAMKQHNINAIRTSHYPPHPELLELTDELGFWVILENDLETHGFELEGWQRNPSDDPVWREAYLDRIARTVHRDKNHASIVMWSLGNEAGTGCNLEATARWVHAFDPSRLVHYEGDPQSTYVDVYSQMYAPPDEVEAIGGELAVPPGEDVTAAQLHRRTLPYLQCEYAHAMGHGPGGLVEYEEIFDRYPRIAGAFVWEWVEHGLAVVDESGRRTLTYGGDHGERVHDGNFVIDGLVSPDREPRPALLDVKAVMAPVRLRPTLVRDRVAVENRYDALDLSHVRLSWSRTVDGTVVASGDLPVPELGPRSSADVALPDAAGDPVPSRVADVLTVLAVLADDAPWAAAGHELAFGEDVRVGRPVVPPTVPVLRGTDGWSAGPALLDPLTGDLLTLGGVAAQGPTVGLWRAPTDNDRARAWAEADLPSWSERWEQAGLDRAVRRVLDVAERDGALVVRTRTAGPMHAAAIDATWTWRAVSPTAVLLDVDLEPVGRWEVPLARLGIDLVLDAAPLGLRVAGRGPQPSAPDTGAGARTGWHQLDADALLVPHVRPQEQAARPGTLAAVLRTAAGTLGIDVVGGDPLHPRAPGGPGLAVTVLPLDRADLAAARHAHEVRADGRSHVSLDLGQSGVGTATCGPGVLPRYVLHARPASVRLLLTVDLDPQVRG